MEYPQKNSETGFRWCEYDLTPISVISEVAVAILIVIMPDTGVEM